MPISRRHLINCAVLALGSSLLRPVLAQGQLPKLSVAQRKKIQFDLNQIGEDGLRGPSDGKVSVDYEFVIPDTKVCREKVRQLNPTVKFLPGSSGRIGAKKGQCLCIATTGKNWRVALYKLAALPYIERILQCYYE